jgi:hypothetical protein
MIIKIPFADSSAKLLSMLVKSGPGEQTASKIKLVRECITYKIDEVYVSTLSSS